MHYADPGLEVRTLPGQEGSGVFATRRFEPGELLLVWGGRIITGAQLGALPPDKRHWMLQIDEDLFQLTDPAEIGMADQVNHSCDPNSGIFGHIALVALHVILPGEEICFDYATTDSTQILRVRMLVRRARLPRLGPRRRLEAARSAAALWAAFLALSAAAHGCRKGSRQPARRAASQAPPASGGGRLSPGRIDRSQDGEKLLGPKRWRD